MNQKSILAILTSLMMVTSLIGGLTSVLAYTPPGGWPDGQPYFNLRAVVGPDPFWGYYSGYHDIWYKIQPELAKIGINLEIKILADMYDLWYIMWDVDDEADITPATNPDGSYNSDGWDMTTIEWWLMPTGLLWVESMIYESMIPPIGFNNFPYRNERSDELLWKGQHTLDAKERQSYLWAWQEEMMHDPPLVNLYYPHTYSMYGSYLKGWYGTVWFWDMTNIRINASGLTLPSDVHNRLTVEKALVYATTEDVWMWNPFFVDTYTAEAVNAITMGTLYTMTLNPWPAEGQVPNPWDYTTIPELASGPPVYQGVDVGGPYDGLMRVRVPLREGVKWSDNDPFDAEDVKFTYDLVLDIDYQSTGTGDVSYLVQALEYVGGEPGTGGYDPYSIDFILTSDEYYPDFETVFSNDWGTVIIPAHYFKPIIAGLTDPSAFMDHESNTFAGAVNIPSIGPFMLDSKKGKEYVKLVKNPNYFGYDPALGLNWGPYDVEVFYFKWITDSATRFAAIQTHEADFGEYPTAPVTRFTDLIGEPDLTIYKTPYVASNPIWFNLKTPNLGNRYVRLAIAHAIPYEDILSEILPGWGVTEPIPGGTWILPWQYYTDPVTGETVQLFNTEMPAYEYNIDKAKEYMQMYLNSKETTDYTLGPVGDADFSGIVNHDDFFIWRANFDTTPAEWTYTPGNDIDPDFDNDGDVDFIQTPPDTGDWELWRTNYGTRYPDVWGR